MQVHGDSRGSLLPDPRYDVVRCIVLAAANDVEDVAAGRFAARALLFDAPGAPPSRLGLPDITVSTFDSEGALLDGFVAAVRALDPDIILGYEVQQGSIGFLVERAAALERPAPLLRELSRTPGTPGPKENQHDEYGQAHASGIYSTGRIVLNLWRLLRDELKLRIYTFEACAAAVLQLRTPRVPPWQLAQWFRSGSARWRCVDYWVRRARLSLAMVEQLDLVRPTRDLRASHLAGGAPQNAWDGCFITCMLFYHLVCWCITEGF